jgi:hypothetical protein
MSACKGQLAIILVVAIIIGTHGFFNPHASSRVHLRMLNSDRLNHKKCKKDGFEISRSEINYTSDSSVKLRGNSAFKVHIPVGMNPNLTDKEKDVLKRKEKSKIICESGEVKTDVELMKEELRRMAAKWDED